jgi:hypothetical protein
MSLQENLGLLLFYLLMLERPRLLMLERLKKNLVSTVVSK